MSFPVVLANLLLLSLSCNQILPQRRFPPRWPSLSSLEGGRLGVGAVLFPGPPRGLSEVGLTSDSLDILGFGWFLGSVREARLTSSSLFTLITRGDVNYVYKTML